MTSKNKLDALLNLNNLKQNISAPDKINTEFVGHFVGMESRNIKPSSKKSKVRNRIDKNTVQVTGILENEKLVHKEVETLRDLTLIEYSSEAVEINPEHVGIFLGKEGRNIQALSKKFNVRMRVDENTVRITGMPDHVQMAREEVELKYPRTEDKYSESFEVKSQYVGSIIGRGGSRIKSLRSGHMVNIKIDKDIKGDAMIQIYGDKDNVKSARRGIEKIVSELSFKMNAEYEEVMKFNPDQIRRIVGKHGKNIEAIKQEFDVLVEIGADNEVQISGARQNVIVARKDIQMTLKLVHVETRILKNEQRYGQNHECKVSFVKSFSLSRPENFN